MILDQYPLQPSERETLKRFYSVYPGLQDAVLSVLALQDTAHGTARNILFQHLLIAENLYACDGKSMCAFCTLGDFATRYRAVIDDEVFQTMERRTQACQDAKASVKALREEAETNEDTSIAASNRLDDP